MQRIHPQLQNDCLVLGKFPLSFLLLMKDANYPWFILVPDREGITEIYQLSEEDQGQLLVESSSLARFLMRGFNADKLNIAAIGNIVPQLHMHHVVRYRTDPAWPAPVWGKLAARDYTDNELNLLLDKVRQANLKDFILSSGS